MQLDESTDIANVDQLLVYIRYAHKNRKWEFHGFVHPRCESKSNHMLCIHVWSAE
jgi:hypothetical protein